MRTIILIIALFLTTAVNSQWVLQNTGTSSYLYDMWMFSPDKVIISGQNGLILKTTDGGGNWDSIPTHTTSSSYMFFLNDNTGWIAGSDTLIKTVNGGNTWTFLSSTSGRTPFFLNASTGWMGSGNNNAKKTTNGGVNWTNVPMPQPCLAGVIHFVNSTTGFVRGVRVVQDSTYIFKTTNSGLNWFVQSGLNKYYDAVYFLDENNIYLAGLNGTFTRTTDGGLTWGGSDINTFEDFLAVNFVNLNTGYIVGSYGARFKTTNGGLNWEDQSLLNTVESGTDVCFMPGNDQIGYISGDDGGVYKTINGGVIGINQISSEVPAKFSLNQNYPNPFNPVTNIKFSVPKAGNVRLVVFDALGREVAELVNQNLKAGTFNYDFDASQLSTGVYFYRLTGDGFSEIKKMMLIK